MIKTIQYIPLLKLKIGNLRTIFARENNEFLRKNIRSKVRNYNFYVLQQLKLSVDLQDLAFLIENLNFKY